jgi:hypothetical protein
MIKNERLGSIAQGPGRCPFRLAARSRPSANGSSRHVLLRCLCQCRPPALHPVRVEVAMGVEELDVHIVDQGRPSDVVQAELGLVVVTDVHGEVPEQGLLIHTADGRLPLPGPASSSAGPVVVDPSLTRRMDTDPTPTERVAAPAPVATGPTCLRANLVVRGPSPSSCSAAAPLSQKSRRSHPPPSNMPAPSLLKRTASRRRRFGSTLASMLSLALMWRRNLGRCWVKNFHSVSSSSTKSFSYRSLWSRAWCLASLRSS